MLQVSIIICFDGFQSGRGRRPAGEGINSLYRKIEGRIAPGFGVYAVVIFKRYNKVIEIVEGTGFIRNKMRPTFSIYGVFIVVQRERPQVTGAHGNCKAVLVRPAGSAFADAPELKAPLLKTEWIHDTFYLIPSKYLPLEPGCFASAHQPGARQNRTAGERKTPPCVVRGAK